MKTGVTLVTGVTGLIGGAVARRLLAEGAAIVTSDIVPVYNAGGQFVPHDLRDHRRWSDIIRQFGITKVVHAGGVSGPMVLRGRPAEICDINLQSLAGLLEAARVHGLQRIVWFSSITAYGDRPDLAAVSEQTPLQPSTIYAATKAAGEALLAGYNREYGVDGVALRVASCYGPGRTTSCLIRAIIEDGLAGRTTKVKPVVNRSRQHIFVGDVVDAVIAALQVSTLSERIFNIGPGRMQSLEEIIAGVREAVPGVRVEPDNESLAWNTFGVGPLLIDAARRHLGFEPRTSLADGARQTRDWVEQRE